MTPLITILAHGKAQEVFDRHLPIWRKHGWPIQVYSPDNDPINKEHPDINYVNLGNAAHSGDIAIDRVRETIERLGRLTQFSFHLVCEYDSFLLKDPSLDNGLFGIVFRNYESLLRFHAITYPNPPFWISRDGMSALGGVANVYSRLTEEGQTDRKFAACARYANIPVFDYHPIGFSRATITPEHFMDLREYIQRGAFAFHGIKSKETLDFILSEYAKHHPESHHQG